MSDTWRIALKKENPHFGKPAVWGSRVSFFKVSGVFLQLVLNASDYTFNEFVWHSLEPCRDKQNQTKAAGTSLAALSLSLCYHPSKKLQEFKSRTCSKAFLQKALDSTGTPLKWEARVASFEKQYPDCKNMGNLRQLMKWLIPQLGDACT